MRRIDFHIVVISLVLLLMSLLLAFDSRVGWRGGAFLAMLTFLAMGQHVGVVQKVSQ